MKYSLSLYTCKGKQELILIYQGVFILLCNKNVFILDTNEYVAQLHADTFSAALNKGCKLLGFFIRMVLKRIIKLKNLRNAEICRHYRSSFFTGGKSAFCFIILCGSKDKQASGQLQYGCYSFHKYTTLLKNFLCFY